MLWFPEQERVLQWLSRKPCGFGGITDGKKQRRVFEEDPVEEKHPQVLQQGHGMCSRELFFLRNNLHPTDTGKCGMTERSLCEKCALQAGS